MIRRLSTAAVLGLAVLSLSVPALAADVTRSVPASLSFAAVTTLDLQVRLRSDNTLADTLTFPYTGTEAYVLSDQYIRVAYASTYSNWKIVTYTSNLATTDPLHNNWGAMVGTDTNNRVALMWKAFADTVSGAPAWDGTAADTWMYFKDTGDSDYVGAADGGYTTTFYGSGSAWASVYHGAPDVSPSAVYVGALTGGLVPDVYATRLNFDLLHL